MAPATLICLTGVECTGKTALAGALARKLGAPLVDEFARAYLTGRDGYTADDVLAIARGQLEAEQAALADGGPLVVADTDLTVIQVWWEEKYGAPPDWLVAALAARSPRRYLLPCPDLPWEFDPLRESEHDRQRLHRRYRAILEAGPFPFAEVAGRGPVRLQAAQHQVGQWLDG